MNESSFSRINYCIVLKRTFHLFCPLSMEIVTFHILKKNVAEQLIYKLLHNILSEMSTHMDVLYFAPNRLVFSQIQFFLNMKFFWPFLPAGLAYPLVST